MEKEIKVTKGSEELILTVTPENNYKIEYIDYHYGSFSIFVCSHEILQMLIEKITPQPTTIAELDKQGLI